MALEDPVAIYETVSNVEAFVVRDILLAAGIEAFVVEDVSPMMTILGSMQKPKVWVERGDVERAKPILEKHERRNLELQEDAECDKSPVQATCDECGKRSPYPPKQRGSVQECPHCGAFVDVEIEGEGEIEGWSEFPANEGEAS